MKKICENMHSAWYLCPTPVHTLLLKLGGWKEEEVGDLEEKYRSHGAIRNYLDARLDNQGEKEVKQQGPAHPARYLCPTRMRTVGMRVECRDVGREDLLVEQRYRLRHWSVDWYSYW